ncbi:MAG: TraR/DksA family transcriptional regulator [Flavobacteriales bacterium]|jgi:DnaK suppressor protein|nr:TraR/DksA family transcriptional regulator [Flavobacteriales bacterium]NCG30889.1 TraR/DksA family transcriptional regulator [Bacteroidota bacterium]MBT3963100.1 TraR/DksA family transcriptional regulator [Flavobacteriales bacterium]MBT4706078.1 TraR/DksA family transcriptional regulator [Flavobacteriales bacterium]MBT4930675.1 TraR/DksA family transcriptional regulator [Flavobacteriales bacterium]
MKELGRDEILGLLEREIEKTTAIIEEYKKSAGPIAPDDAIGRISRMDAINNRTIVEAALRTAEDKLTKLIHMKDHIDDPDFGNCARCGNEIPPGRLILKPESPYCVRCAS